MGKDSFVQNNGIDLKKKYTVSEFVNLCKNAYGSEVIKEIERRIEK
jgi:hypothetical protein